MKKKNADSVLENKILLVSEGHFQFPESKDFTSHLRQPWP